MQEKEASFQTVLGPQVVSQGIPSPVGLLEPKAAKVKHKAKLTSSCSDDDDSSDKRVKQVKSRSKSAPQKFKTIQEIQDLGDDPEIIEELPHPKKKSIEDMDKSF